MSSVGNVVVVSGTVVTGTVVSETAISGTVESTATNEVETPLDALGVLLTAQAESNTNPNAINALDGPKK